MKKLILYSTLDCHLCDLAFEEIAPCLDNSPWTLEKIDIAKDSDLLKQYRTSIPVLFSPTSGQKFYWPFDRADIKKILADN